MSSSPKSAPIPSSAIAPAASRQSIEALPFAYVEVANLPRLQHFSHREDRISSGAVPEETPKAEANAEREAQVRELGRQQGVAEGQQRFAAQIANERAAIGRALTDFSRDRAVYFRKIEEEAVQLALAIARKVIHRESQVDSLLLMGIVRVALERMEGATAVTLLVPPQRAAEWRKYFASSPPDTLPSNSPSYQPAKDLPEIVEDPTIAGGQCSLRTSMGTAEFGMEVQLKEIEKGLMDLLAARPPEPGEPK